ncbi:MAG: leucine-rich repeat domain-containing protein, partial [Acutalibacteraceae bacterium]
MACALVIVMALTSVPLSGLVGLELPKFSEVLSMKASAATEGYLEYEVEDGEATIISCDDSISGKLVIPDKLGGYPVTSIDDYAFEDCTGLTSVTIGNGVTSIGDDAFRGCAGLTSITVDENNSNYSSLNGVLFNKDQTELLKYPAGKAGAYTIPDSVTSIGYAAFYYCTGLTSVTIPDSVTRIGEDVFFRCTGLKSISIPNSITDIGDYAFLGCAGLTSIDIPDSITNIGDFAFLDCSGLTKITIPNSVTRIGDYTFLGCTSLTTLTIPDSVTRIGEWAFSSCRGLTRVTIGRNVNSIGCSAFIACTDLISIIIPSNVTDIDDWALGYYCENHEYLKVENFTIYGYKDTEAERYAIDNGFKFVNLDDTHTHSYTSKITKAATCTAKGVKTYTCSCGESYTKTIPATGHTYKTTTTKATTSKDGKTVTACKVCGNVSKSTKIYKASSVKLSKTSYTY